MLRGNNNYNYTFSQFIKGSELILNARYARRDLAKPATAVLSDKLTVLRSTFSHADYREIYTDIYDIVKNIFENEYRGNGSIKHISIDVKVNPTNDYDLDIKVIINNAPLPINPSANCVNNYKTSDNWNWTTGTCSNQYAESGAADELHADLDRYFNTYPGTIVVPQEKSTILSYTDAYLEALHPIDFPNSNDNISMDNERDQRFYYNVAAYPNYTSQTCIEYDDLNFYFCEMIDIAYEENPNSFHYLIMDVDVYPDAISTESGYNLLHRYTIHYARPIYHVFHGLLIDDGPINVSTDNTTVY